MDERISVHLISALADCWSAIRARHPEVPGVVILPAPAQRGRLNVLGHFAPIRWKTRRAEDLLLHEVVVVAEHLDRTAEDIFETLVHEAAHALNFARGIHDCSPTSQYHNAKFKASAEELGLEVAKVPNYGWAYTVLAEGTKAYYVSVVDALGQTLVHRRKPVLVIVPTAGPSGGGQSPNDATDDPDGDEPQGRSRKAICSCAPPYIIRVSKKVIGATVIRCDTCGQPFQLA
jgi:hypothetical protein